MRPPSGSWLPAILVIAAVGVAGVLVFVALDRGGGNGPIDPPRDPVNGDGGVEPPGTTVLEDRPPIAAPDREGRISFGPYSQHDMAPECTVTDVRARVVSASGVVEVVEDAVGTNNLHVMLEYEVDRDDARFEIAWTVDHPPGADCSLP